MALITDKAIVLIILVIGFVQIVHIQARHTEYVFGPRQHLDSGQDFGDPSPPDIELHQETPLQNSYTRERTILNERDERIQSFQKFLKEYHNISFYVDEDGEFVFNDSDDFDGSKETLFNAYDEYDDDYYDEDYDYSQVPLKRVRRRIIPIGGGALDRGRSGRNGPYERTRNPWDQPSYRNRDSFARRSGPTGSAALFSLFPDLAPPEWKGNKGAKNGSKKKKSSNKDKDKGSNKNKKGELSENEKLEEKSQKDEPSPSDDSVSQKRKSQKKKTKLSKKEKEEIAKFAESHGVERLFLILSQG